MFCSALGGHYLPVVGTDRTEGSVNSRNGLEILRENIQKRVSSSVWAVSSWLGFFHPSPSGPSRERNLND